MQPGNGEDKTGALKRPPLGFTAEEVLGPVEQLRGQTAVINGLLCIKAGSMIAATSKETS
jgi:hypothetical protein